MSESRNRPARGLTELENCTLGIVGQLGPCTSYTVRRYLGESTSSYWTASAGAMYPLLERLANRGLLAVSEQAFGSRTRRAYRLSAAGRRKLKQWLTAPVTDAEATFTHDPLRTRLYFMDIATPKERRAFVDDAIAKTERAIADQRRTLQSLNDDVSPWERLGGEGSLRELEARIRWLRDVRKAVAG